MTTNKIKTTAIVALLSFAILGCSGNTVNIKSKTAILYAKRDAIYEYRNGKSRKVFNNPAGYDSLDTWLGYSYKLKGIVFQRSVYNKLMIITHIDSKSPSAENLDCVDTYRLDTYGFSLIGDLFFQIRGEYNNIELWKCSKTEKWSRSKSWIIPKKMPLPKKWVSPPALIKDSVVFVTPSGYLVKANRKNDAIAIISDGNSAWINDEDANEEYLASFWTPSISNNGEYIAWRPHPSPNDDNASIKIASIDGSFRKDYRAVTGQVALIYWLDDRYLVCEETTVFSGLSRLYVVDKDKGPTGYILAGVERRQWCVVK
jgi:hypothetical protein